MKYFLHDSSSFDDEKITELYINYGYEGLGLFYTILEKLAKQEKPIKTDVLKHQLKVGKRLNKCWKFMEEIGLISSNNGETFNKQLLNFSEKYQIKKEKNAKRISEWRKNQSNIENVTSYEHVSNIPKVNRSKVNKKEKKRFYPPSLDEIQSYFIEKIKEKNLPINANIEATKFESFYASKNWYVGKNKMTDWRKAVSGWIARQNTQPAKLQPAKGLPR